MFFHYCFPIGTYAVELPPKLSALLSIFEDLELKAENKAATDHPSVLILVSNIHTIELIKYFLTHGKSKLLDWLVQGRMSYEHPKETEEESPSPSPKKNNPPPRPETYSHIYRPSRRVCNGVFLCKLFFFLE